MEDKELFENEDAQTFGEPVHVFPLDGGGMVWLLESQLPPDGRPPQDERPVESDKDHQPRSPKETQPLSSKEPTVQPAPTPKIGLLLPSVLLLVNLLILFTAFFSVYFQTVTITIIPKSTTLTSQLTLTDIASRVFEPLSQAQTKTVVTTGHIHQNATAARGTITFYNASEQQQTIDAGTLLTGSDGVQVVTDQPAYLPGSTPPTETQATVQAHAVNAGANGNISAGDIKGSCCRVDILVDNAAFSGGQDSRNVTIVTRQDIQSAVSALLPTLTQTITQHFERQVRSTETLVQPHCSQTIIPDHLAGEEAATVTVTVKTTCLAGAYNTASLQAKIIQALAHKEPGYQLHAYFPLASLQVALRNQRVIVSGTYQARFLYHFTQAETKRLLVQIKGKQKRQAIQLLAALPGVARIAITTPSNQELLPTDTAYIHLIIVS